MREQVAAAAVARALGISRRAVVGYERGEPVPADHRAALAEYFEVSETYLMREEQPPERTFVRPHAQPKLRLLPGASRQNRLRELRGLRGLTARELAEQLGLTPPLSPHAAARLIEWYEAGKVPIPAGREHELAALLGVSVGWLIGEA